MGLEATEPYAEACDKGDELARFRDCFYRDPATIYLDGNSLGLLSRQAEAAVLRVLEEWKTLAVDGWTLGQTPWFEMAETLAAQMAPLLGAEPGEVIVANSTTVNLHQLLATLFQPESTRHTVLADALSFPSDRYALDSHLRLRGLDPRTHLKLVPSPNGYTLEEEALVAAMTPEVALIVLPSVLYHSGQLLDMATLTEQAHRRNILIGFDCSHSVGTIPHRLSEWGVDFAFWCGYKYLNNGPGGTGGLYLNRRHFGVAPGLAGWFSSCKERQFDMSPLLDAAPDAGALQIGTPNLLSMAPLQGALEMIAEAGIERIRRKSLLLTDYLMRLLEERLEGFGFTLANPREAHRRGGHVSLVHPEATRICKALKAAGVVPDYRPPQIVRLAPVALYTSFTDCYRAVQRLQRIMADRSYEAYAAGRERIA
jgi:kynureninase